MSKDHARSYGILVQNNPVNKLLNEWIGTLALGARGYFFRLEEGPRGEAPRRKKNNLWSHEYCTSFPCCAVAWETTLFLSQPELLFYVGWEAPLFVSQSQLLFIWRTNQRTKTNSVLIWRTGKRISRLLRPEAHLSPSVLVIRDICFLNGLLEPG